MVRDKIYWEFNRTLLFYFFLIEIILFFITFRFGSPLIALVIACGAIICVWVLKEPLLLLVATISYITVLPSEAWGIRYDMFQFYVDPRIVLLLIFILLISAVFSRIFNLNNIYEKSNKITFLDRLFIAFFVYTIFNVFWGLSLGNSVFYIKNDSFYLFLYVGYFIIRLSNNWNKVAKYVTISIIFASTISSIQYLRLTASSQSIFDFLINRTFTQHPTLTIVSIPLLGAVVLFHPKKRYKALSTILIIPNLLMATLSQTRGVWGGLFVSISILLLFYNFRNGVTILKLLRIFLLIIFGILIFSILMLIIERIFGVSLIFTVLRRLLTIQNITLDPSFQMRIMEIEKGIEAWKNYIIFGAGLGAAFNRIIWVRINTGIDNSYIYILWKLGLVGGILYFFIICTYCYQSIKVYFEKISELERIIIVGFTSGMFGLFITALTNMCLVHYRYIFLWSLIIAITHNYFNQIRYRSDKRLI